MSRRERKSLRKRVRKGWRFYAPHLRAHRRVLLLGGLASLGVVGSRAALPLPLAQVVRSVGGVAGTPGTETRDTLLPTALAFLGLYAALGVFDLWSRVLFARFAISSVSDVRSAGLSALSGVARRDAADLITRLVGDTARLKDGLKGFLVHVATNGLLFVAVVVALGFLQLRLAFQMGVGLVLVSLVTACAAALVYRRAIQLRERESRLAGAILDAAGSGAAAAHEPERWSGFEASLTRIQGRATLIVYCILGVVLARCLLSAAEAPDASTQLVAFSSYALILVHPVVRLSRQGTRFGKLLACAVRIERVVRPRKPKRGGVRLPVLSEGLVLERLARRGGRGRRSRFGPLDLVLRPGERIALAGAPGSGKTSLLHAIAARRRQDEGRVLWDGVELSTVPGRERARRIVLLEGRAALEGFLEERRRARAEPGAPRDEGGAEPWPDVVLVDDPGRGRAVGPSAPTLAELLGSVEASILVVTRADAGSLDGFDRLIVLDRGRVAFDGEAALAPEGLGRGGAIRGEAGE